MTITLDMGIELLDGSIFSYENPDVSNISIEMLADVLSRINRFAGHTNRFYSVAQHAVNVSLIVVEDHHKKAGLLHDTAEAFTNDLPTPLKVALPGIKDIEFRIESRLAEKFGFEYPLAPEVKLADLQMLGVEKEVLKPSSSEWEILRGVDLTTARSLAIMQPLNPAQARDLFLTRWEMVRAF